MKFLVINSDFYGYGTFITNTLKEYGFEAELLTMDKQGLIPFFRDKFFPKFHITCLSRYFFKKFQAKIKEKVAEKKYDVIIAFFGDVIVCPETLVYIKNNFPGTRMVLWLSDKFERFKDFKEILSYFDRVFTFECSDIPLLKKIYNGDIKHLMLFYDNVYYNRPKTEIKKDIDFLFIGAWYGHYYKTRRKALSYIAKFCKENSLKFIIIGPGSWRNPLSYIRDLFYAGDFSKHVRSGRISHNKINDYYQRSKVIVNIPIDCQVDGYPMRTFEVPGSGNCLLTHYMPGLEKIYDCSNEVTVFHNLEELGNKCKELIFNENKRKVIAENGYLRSINEHTLSHRIKTILDSIGISMNAANRIKENI